ncbi:unnamed protein product [Closterium sp. Naga37s-1]|nr:unnamed protein product [Closterium sp. Naga37s-1]
MPNVHPSPLTTPQEAACGAFASHATWHQQQMLRWCGWGGSMRRIRLTCHVAPAADGAGGAWGDDPPCMFMALFSDLSAALHGSKEVGAKRCAFILQHLPAGVAHMLPCLLPREVRAKRCAFILQHLPAGVAHMLPEERTRGGSGGGGSGGGSGNSAGSGRGSRGERSGGGSSNGDEVVINPHMEAITGYSREELSSVDSWFSCLFRERAEEEKGGRGEGEGHLKSGRMGSRWRVRQILEADRAMGLRESRTLRMVRRDGAPRWLEVAVRDCGAGGGDLWVVSDITDHLIVREKFRLLYEASSVSGW